MRLWTLHPRYPRKLRTRSREDYLRWRRVDSPYANPLFTVTDGPAAPWERR